MSIPLFLFVVLCDGSAYLNTIYSVLACQYLDILLMRRLLSFPLIIFVLLVASCQPQATATISTPSVEPTPEIIVTRVVGTVQPTPTPAVCTPLPEGMELAVEPVSSERAKVQVQGLRSGEDVTLLFVARPTATQGSSIEIGVTNMVESDGSLTYETGGLSALMDAVENIWTVKVIHARGVACQEFSLPQ